MKKGRKKLKTQIKYVRIICWIIIPTSAVTLLVLDALGLYKITSQRLIILGAYAAFLLLPFCKEITIKDFSIKKDSDDK